MPLPSPSITKQYDDIFPFENAFYDRDLPKRRFLYHSFRAISKINPPRSLKLHVSIRILLIKLIRPLPTAIVFAVANHAAICHLHWRNNRYSLQSTPYLVIKNKNRPPSGIKVHEIPHEFCPPLVKTQTGKR